mgnify:CR=1 FL=1
MTLFAKLINFLSMTQWFLLNYKHTHTPRRYRNNSIINIKLLRVRGKGRKEGERYIDKIIGKRERVCVGGGERERGENTRT